MSTIITAPQARLPIETIVAQPEDAIIREAIGREVHRGGQVFYLHNRIQSIYGIQEKLLHLFPDLYIGVAHGKMHESELESTMIQFIEHKLDILVCTTIIESGLDIPNVNTIVIDRADRFGLAELYQLRGRVGRYDRQAYAYLFLPKDTILLDNAKKRLAAIRRYTQLGAGFKLAIKDLEIRGAGNIIGAEQSGHISAIGFNLYCQFLKEAVARLKIQPSLIRREVKVDMDFLVSGKSKADLISAYIPNEQIREDDQRLVCYRRLSTMNEFKKVEDFREELQDRFGPLPPPLLNLLKLTKIKIILAEIGVKSITIRERKVILDSKKGLYRTSDKKFPRLKSDKTQNFLDELLSLVGEIKNAGRFHQPLSHKNLITKKFEGSFP